MGYYWNNERDAAFSELNGLVIKSIKGMTQGDEVVIIETEIIEVKATEVDSTRLEDKSDE